MHTCPHCRQAASVQSSQDYVALRGTGTATEAQEARILAALRLGPVTTDDLRRLGIYQASARIFGLRGRGYDIETTLFNGWSADGYSHARMARYTLRSEPPEQTTLALASKQPEDGEAQCK